MKDSNKVLLYVVIHPKLYYSFILLNEFFKQNRNN